MLAHLLEPVVEFGDTVLVRLDSRLGRLVGELGVTSMRARL
jgi:hypothetical protein